MKLLDTSSPPPKKPCSCRKGWFSVMLSEGVTRFRFLLVKTETRYYFPPIWSWKFKFATGQKGKTWILLHCTTRLHTWKDRWTQVDWCLYYALCIFGLISAPPAPTAAVPEMLIKEADERRTSPIQTLTYGCRASWLERRRGRSRWRAAREGSIDRDGAAQASPVLYVHFHTHLAATPTSVRLLGFSRCCPSEYRKNK